MASIETAKTKLVQLCLKNRRLQDERLPDDVQAKTVKRVGKASGMGSIIAQLANRMDK